LKIDKIFDFAIVGAGASGLQLLFELLQSNQNDQFSVLLIDSGDRSSKSWCFWTDSNETSFPNLVQKSWNQLNYCTSTNQNITENISPVSYHYISSNQFFAYFFETFIPNDPRIYLVNDRVEMLTENLEHVTIHCQSGIVYEAKVVADSRRTMHTNEAGIQQHFSGKFISFEQPMFNPDCFTLMDFSLEFSNSKMAVFHYILPFTAHEALIETTVFTELDFDQELYDTIWEKYVQLKFGKRAFHLVSEEQGSIPMQMIPPSIPTKIIKIGVAGGYFKPSTGYAFNRMHQHAKSIVLKKELKVPKRFAFYDKMLLKVMKNEISQVPSIMDSLFMRVPFFHILRFLDNKSTFLQDVSLLSKLNIPLFLKHFLK